MRDVQAHAEEMADLEMRLLELEIQKSGGFGSAFNMVFLLLRYRCDSLDAWVSRDNAAYNVASVMYCF
jgi:hypothetical protein